MSLLLAGCGEHRSVSAYCRVFYNQGTQAGNGLNQADNNLSSDPWDSVVDSLSTPEQQAQFFKKLNAVAPHYIEPDVAIVHHAFQQEADSGMTTGLPDRQSSIPALSMVQGFTRQECATTMQATTTTSAPSQSVSVAP